MHTCASCASNIRAGRIASFMHFDPRRSALLLIGGEKTGDNRWYEEYVRLADAIYDRHLREMESE